MAADPVRVEAPAFDEEAFRLTFRAFHAQFSAALDAGVDLGTLLSLLESEGVELPDFVRMML
jgi:hypothetical protein